MTSTQHGDWAGPLAGIRVIGLTRVLAGPFATQSLGDLGAEILKIEPPGGGDETRRFPPFLEGESHYFLGINRNKKSLVIDLQQEAGADLLRRLVAGADILVENYRPGVMERLGGMLGYFAQLACITGEDPPPMGSSHPNIVPYGSFPASDGSIIIAVLS